MENVFEVAASCLSLRATLCTAQCSRLKVEIVRLAQAGLKLWIGLALEPSAVPRLPWVSTTP